MLTTRQSNLYIHAYPNYQALFRALAAVRSGLKKFRKLMVGPHIFGNRWSDLIISGSDGRTLNHFDKYKENENLK